MNITDIVFREKVRRIYKLFLKKDKEDFESKDKEDYGTPFTICTNCCTWLADNYFTGGTTMGYWLNENPTAIVGRNCLGHDFFIVEDYLIDFWYRGIEGVKRAPICINLRTQKKLIKKYYGDSLTWRTLDNIKLSEIWN